MTNKQKIMTGLGLLYIGYGTAVQGNINASIYCGIVSIVMGLMTLINKRNLINNLIKVLIMSLIQFIILYVSTIYKDLPSLFILGVANGLMAQSILVTDYHWQNMKLVEVLTVVFMGFIILAAILPLRIVNFAYDIHLVSSSMDLVVLISCIFLPHLMPYFLRLVFAKKVINLDAVQPR